jgi:lipoprotein-anchoring transpeptidase ErfK/SrfK
MSRSSHSFWLRSGLVVASILATMPTMLHAETNPQRGQTLQPQISKTVKQTQSTSTPNPFNPTLSNSKSNSIPQPNPVNPTTGAKSTATASTTQTPVVEVVNLVLKLKEKRVYVYQGNKFVAKYPVAIGRKGRETPTGEWQVMEKIENPGWTNFNTGQLVAPGPQNPLGERWIGFWTDGQDTIGFHGTPDVKSVGTAVSNGCVRMYNQDVKALFPLVKVGTTVKVVN